MFIGSPHIGGKVLPSYNIYGHIEIIKDEHIYRVHPNFEMEYYWFDWAYFEWESFEQPLPARRMMIINLNGAIITCDIDQNPDIENSENYHNSITNLTK